MKEIHEKTHEELTLWGIRCFEALRDSQPAHRSDVGYEAVLQSIEAIIKELRTRERERLDTQEFLKDLNSIEPHQERHPYGDSYTGMLCGALVLDKDGYGDECGLPAKHPIHQ